MYMLLKGLLIGLSIAAPVGPIGLLCVQRSLRSGFKIGFLTGMGAATADAIYGLVAGLGLNAISSALASSQFLIQLTGGGFLLYLGAKLIKTSPQKAGRTQEKPLSGWATYGSTLFLTLTNPATILSFTAIFAGVGVGIESNDYIKTLIFVLGVGLGSALWWCLLSGGVAFILRHKIGKSGLRWINILSGLVLVVFGFVALLPIAKAFFTQ